MICAAARELLEWCDVPRTKEHYMAGYQRVLTDRRVEEIGKYLRLSDDNTVPGAIIVAADAEYVSVHKDGNANGQTQGNGSNEHTKDEARAPPYL